jgi:hypothetical protein
MSFSISFLDEPLEYPFDDKTTPAAPGRLVLGEEQEFFQSSLFQWSKEDYEAQWRYAIKTLLDGGEKAALIVEYVSPEFATQLEWWPMYRQVNSVYIQDHLLFYDQLSVPFSLNNAFSRLKDRETKDADGQSISEWCVSLSDVKKFAQSFLVS